MISATDKDKNEKDRNKKHKNDKKDKNDKRVRRSWRCRSAAGYPSSASSSNGEALNGDSIQRTLSA